MYFCFENLERVCATHGRDAGQILIKDCGNLLRDLFPNYGVYEVLGRMANDEFAALTMRPEFASRDRFMAGIWSALASRTSPVALSIGVAHFDPRKPHPIDELLAAAKRDTDQTSGESGAGLPVSRFGRGHCPHTAYKPVGPRGLLEALIDMTRPLERRKDEILLAVRVKVGISRGSTRQVLNPRHEITCIVA